MGRFSDDLRSAREQREVSLETISRLTKISGRHLLALETGAFEELPGGIFRRGFLRSYLAALHLPEQPWLARFETELNAAEASAAGSDGIQEFAENVQRSRPAQPAHGRLRWPGVLALLLLLLIVGWTLWHLASGSRGSLTVYP